MNARFEIVRTDADQPWHARFRAANGRIVWVTENYTRRRAARDAITQILCHLDSRALVFIRDVDERGDR